MPQIKRIRLENFEIPNIVDYKKDYIESPDSLPTGVKLNKITENIIDEFKNYLNSSHILGVGEKYIDLVSNYYNSGIQLYIPKNVKVLNPININFNMDEKNPTVVEQNIIVAESGSQVTIVFDYSTDSDTEAFHNGLTKVYANENSVVNIIKVQRMNDKSHSFDSNVAIVRSHGKVNWISVEIGSNYSASNYLTKLNEDCSEGHLSSMYLGDGVRKIDLEYSMIHKGIRTISNIDTKGVLKDSAEKIFKGNLDFRTGAKHSVGSENEYITLLDPTVKSDSIPALLCGEDDVQGEHAVSAGQINENQLFYLMSRGLSEKESKKLIIESAFRPIIDKISSNELRQIINNEIARRL